jgi:hypothetical protein
VIPVHLLEANIFLSVAKTLLVTTVFLRKTIHENPVCCVRIFRHKACLYVPLVGEVKHILCHWKEEYS